MAQVLVQWPCTRFYVANRKLIEYFYDIEKVQLDAFQKCPGDIYIPQGYLKLPREGFKPTGTE